MFKLNLVTPEKKLVLDQEISEVTVPAFRGTLNILPGHAPLITTLETGIMEWKFAGQAEVHRAVVSGGYCEVNPQGVDVLADVVDLPEEIDPTQRREWIIEGEKILASQFLEGDKFDLQKREIERARAGLALLNEK